MMRMLFEGLALTLFWILVLLGRPWQAPPAFYQWVEAGLPSSCATQSK
jgi:hypothetical protein